jgi:CubicO group peptidase (beta-lactamase class C family)
VNGTAVAAVDHALGNPEQRLTDWQVPAIEIAVVAGEDSFAGGFGQRGVADPAAVGSSTLFHHGSCGKAVTSLLAAVLADEGLVDLDQPVRQVVPELRTADPILAERITLRDLLCHRSGLGRHDLAWILRPHLDELALLQAISALPPAGDLRAGFEYSNFGYALAGIVLTRAAGASWSELVTRRLLQPAGMKQTTVDAFPDADATTDRAAPHVLRGGAPHLTGWRSIGAISPAGQLVTCAEDSMQWLRIQLGQVPATVPAAAVVATHHPQVVLSADGQPHEPVTWTGYGLGWVTGTFRGRSMLWHSGGIDGFLTNILLLPDDRIGVAVSANLHLSNLPFALVHEIADRLLGIADHTTWYDRVRAAAEAEATAPPPHPGSAPPSHPVADFEGEYFDAGYGTLTVRTNDGALGAQLEAGPLTLTHRHYDTWDAYYEPLEAHFPLTFGTDADGHIAGVAAVMGPDEPPVRFTRRSQGDPR